MGRSEGGAGWRVGREEGAGWRGGEGGRGQGGGGGEGREGGRGWRGGGGGGGRGQGWSKDGKGRPSPRAARTLRLPASQARVSTLCPVLGPRSQAARACPGSWRPSSDELRAQRAWLGWGLGASLALRRLRTQHTRRPQPHPTPRGTDLGGRVPEAPSATRPPGPRALPAGASSLDLDSWRAGCTSSAKGGRTAPAARSGTRSPPPSAQAARGRRPQLWPRPVPGARASLRPQARRTPASRGRLGPGLPPAGRAPCPVRKAALPAVRLRPAAPDPQSHGPGTRVERAPARGCLRGRTRPARAPGL